jgi:TonB family protein
MRRIGIIRHHGAVYALLLMWVLAAWVTKAAGGQREQFERPPAGPPHIAFQPPDYQYASIPGTNYPPSAIKQRHEGTVNVLATLDTNGSVIEAKIYQSSGYIELDRAGMKTVQARQFQPCTPKSRFHDKCTVAIPVVFHLPGHDAKT